SFTARADRSAESVENRTASVETVETTFVEQPVSEDHPYCLRTETMPAFQGGDFKTFYHWVQMQVRVPAEAMEKRLQGRVTVSFIVERDGTLGDIRILQTPDKVFSEEVMRVLEHSDKWTPGIDEHGDTVRVGYTLPVDFKALSD
ncbi:MAG: energy transducer TonB, partial [Alistipes sp.]|nr:energy transducer TonB [Alistipes sp.]